MPRGPCWEPQPRRALLFGSEIRAIGCIQAARGHLHGSGVMVMRPARRAGAKTEGRSECQRKERAPRESANEGKGGRAEGERGKER